MRRYTRSASVSAILALTLALVGLGSRSGQVGLAQAPTARQVVEAAAQTLGGLDRVRGVRTITAHGYGQYAYMLGGGRISGEADAPEKYMAANDLTRVWDLANDRFEMRERRNMLFPFLLPFGHSFALNVNGLDGDIAFDRQGERAVRVARFTESALMIDGVHMRRMWMLNNPVVLVRTMLDPGTQLSAPRQETSASGTVTVIDVTLRQGDRLSAGFANQRPVFVRWSNPQTNIGQANLTTTFSGWVMTSGLLMPLGYQTRMDWRNVDFFKLYVDAYDVDTPVADLAAPAAVRAAAEPPSFPTTPLTSVPVAKGIWRISNGTSVVEFRDHLVLFELGVNARGQAKAVLDHARALVPGKPIRYLIASHNHFDHTMGIREAVAEGITIIQRASTEQQFREMVAHGAPDYPDDLQKNPQAMTFIRVDERYRLQDDTMTLDVLWGRNNGHMADVLFAYAPAQRVMLEGDLVSAAYDWAHWPDTFRESIAYYTLDIEKVSPVHAMTQVAPDVLTFEQADQVLRGGTQRARQHCAEQLGKANYWPGCPIQSRFYPDR